MGYHPATNGQAERSVQTVKNALKAMQTIPSTINANLNELLRQYRRDPHSTTGQAPSQLFLGRLIRSRLDLIIPDTLDTKINKRQFHERKFRTFQPGQKVWFLSNNPREDKWLRGWVSRRLGDIHYEIQAGNKVQKRHINQIRKREEKDQKTNDEKRNQREHRIRIHYYPPAPASSSAVNDSEVASTPPRVNSQCQQPPPAPRRQPIAPEAGTLRRSTR